MDLLPNHHSGRYPARALLALCACTLFTVLFLAVAPSTKAADTDEPQEFGSVEERRLYNAIQEERAGIREERRELEMRKNELKSMEEGVDKKLAEVDAKIAELRELSKKIARLLEAKSEDEKEKTKELAKIYEKMSPDKAALALSGLDKQLAADLLAAMKVKAAAKILDQISQQKARELSTTYSTLQLE